MANEQANTQTQEGGSTEVQPIIPGTTYLTPEEAAKGYQELKALVDRQGNELGMTRKQLEQATKMLESAMTKGQAQAAKPEKPAGPDYDAELAAIDQAIEKLDVDEPGYTKQLAALNRKSRELVARAVEERTSTKLMSKFEETLNQRDTMQGQKAWEEANPDFRSPEMQMAIQEHMSKDRTGVMDPVLAYREIQHQQALQKLQMLAEEKAELEGRLKLKEGAAQTGKVITKGQSTQAKTQPTQKLKGADLDAAMLEAYNNAAGM